MPPTQPTGRPARHPRGATRLRAQLAPLAMLAVIQALGAGHAVAQREPDRDRGASSLPQHVHQGGPEAASRRLCEAEPDRVFVSHALGTECIAYVLTAAPAAPASGTQPTVFYFHGDLTAREVQQPDFTVKHLARLRPALGAIAERENTRFIYVARPGVLGSSGHHGERLGPKEIYAMNAAVDAIKARLGLTSIVVAGQSGGSTIAAALLTLGRRDIDCAVLGSGALMLKDTMKHLRASTGTPLRPDTQPKRVYFDPSDRVADIPQQPGRRIFVLGDPIDSRTPFALQKQFAGRLKAFGHHAVVVEVVARGESLHGVAHLTLPAAAHCAHGRADGEITRLAAPASASPAGRLPPGHVGNISGTPDPL